MTRTNRLGLIYTFTPAIVGDEDHTHVSCRGKTVNLPYLIHDIMEAWDDWENGELLQEAFHFMSADEREFILTGITPGQWQSLKYVADKLNKARGGN